MTVNPTQTVFAAVYLLLSIFLLLLIGRLVMDYVMMFARGWRPRRWAAVSLEVMWSVTDPPLRKLRALIPPLRIGAMSLDLGFIVIFLIVIVLLQIAFRLAT